MKNLYTKLHAFQKEVGVVKKTEVNPFFRSKYVDINGIIDAIKPLLDKHGLVIMQPLTELNGKPALMTIIAEVESGEALTSTVPLPENQDAQKMGSAVTYFRRYALQSLCFLEAEDDDGTLASQTQTAPIKNNTRPQQNDPNEPPPIDYGVHEIANQIGGEVIVGKLCVSCGKPTGTNFPKCKACYYKK